MESAEKIEKEFDSFFSELRYQRVSEIVGESPDFSNADYINKPKKVAVELKIIDKDFFEFGGIIDVVQGFLPIPKNVNPDGTGMYELNLPPRNRHGRVDTMEEPLRRIIKKANKQLKLTKERMLNGKGVGFLVLAINMKHTIDPSLIQAMTIKILRKEFKSVNGVIFCTPKVGLMINGLFQPICLHCQEYKLPEIYQNELRYLVSQWCEFINSGGHG